ncbi:hypothetical protein Bca52824_068236 [Brassica carinata]|uniref:UBA domain-containing protein n=1 Tax=Brassica carinata TaxID=52824 RepID=A0A8X7Q159_BRACI|nr:hypothetical protein Bca52824_068236 [Brassica carinata]
MQAETESSVLEVNRGLLKELEDMGFSMARAAWALHHSGNSSLEAAVNWIVDHENDSQFDKMPVVEFNIEIESPNPHDHTAETAQARANELKERARKLREEEETKREREREKERIRAGKEMMETKRIVEENERKRNIALRKAGKDEEKKAREKVMQRVNADKAERKSRLGLPTTSTSALVTPLDTKRTLMLSPSPASKAEEMRECLRSLRRNHKEEDPRTMRRAFDTLLMIVRNAAKTPDEEKYRRIRVTNRLFQERVGRFKEGMEFMELCGFKRGRIRVSVSDAGTRRRYVAQAKRRCVSVAVCGYKLGFEVYSRREVLTYLKMYSDRVEAETVNRNTAKSRLNGGGSGDLSSRGRQVTRKRGRQDDDKWEHDLFDDDTKPRISDRKVDPRDLRLKLQKKHHGLQSRLGGASLGERDLREKLSGTKNPQPRSSTLQNLQGTLLDQP